MRPADISLPADIQSIVILNRTRFDKSVINVIEGLLTGELPEEDKAGVQSLMASFQSQLGYSQRFRTQMATEELYGNSLTQAFPDQLSWNTINDLCEKYEAQAAVSVEIFDTDFIITEGNRKVKKKVDDSGEETEVDEFYAEGVGNVTVGIRLYDAISRQIIDQQLFRRTNRWEAKGVSKADALTRLVQAESPKPVSWMPSSAVASSGLKRSRVDRKVRSAVNGRRGRRRTSAT